MQMKRSPNLPLALTMGEPGGIGGEIALKAWAARTSDNVPIFFVVDDPARLKALSDQFGLNIPIEEIDGPEKATEVFGRALPVFGLGSVPKTQLGQATSNTAPAVLKSIDTAVALTQAGKAAAVVTNPIQKSALYAAGFKHQGHTDYLASLCEGDPLPVMMLACDELRVVPVTVHIPLEQVSSALTTQAIIETARITAHALRQDFRIENPVLAIAGLNPHAGEDGTIGSQDREIIAPAIQVLNSEGINATGPFPADTLFHAAARKKYDAALCMYHDQALIPIKTISFETAVNVICGLPFVRTSPDHGTALDIAAQGIASPAGLIEALKMAAHLAEKRNQL